MLAASGPTIPSAQPVPNFSGVFENLLASLYPIIAATVDPSAGKIPINVPRPDDLRIVPFKLFNSANVGSLNAFADILSTALFNVLDCANNSDIANNPIKTGTNLIPSVNS